MTLPTIDGRRRRLLGQCLAGAAAWLAGAAGLLPRLLHAARPDPAFAARRPELALELLFGDRPMEHSDRVRLDIADLAEDGAVVPVQVETDLEQVSSITLVATKNPVPLVARFELDGVLEPSIATRIKLAESAEVVAVVEAGDRLYAARRFVTVTAGGCGL